MAPVRCEGTHDIYVAEVVGVESEGKVVVITVCRGCDTVNFHEHKVTENPGPLRLLQEEKGKK